MIIKDVNGEKYRLTKDRLAHFGSGSSIEFFILLTDLQAKPQLLGNDDLLAHGEVDHVAVWVQLRTVNEDDSEDSGWVKVPVENNRIGCRTFSPATFAKILKAAGVKPKAVRKTKRKVAR